MKRDKWNDGWRLNLALTAGVMATVMIALVMAQLDALQAQHPQLGRIVIANIQATAIANGAQINLPFGAAVESLAQQISPNATVLPDSNPRTTDTGSSAAAEFPVCGEVPAGWLLYTTVDGDTIALLAEATQSDPNAIMAANCLSNGQLAAGMQILLPGQPAAVQCGPPQTWVRYQVRAGDTMAALAISRGTTVADVLRANCRDSEALLAGQMIFLPPGGPVLPPQAVPTPVAPPITLPIGPTATALPVATNQPPPNPTPAPPNFPTSIPPTIVIPTIPAVPTIPVVPTIIRPTATVPFGSTATPPGVPTRPPTAVAPTATSPAPTATTIVPTIPPPTPVRPTATAPVPPTSTPLPLPTNTPVPLPTNTPVPPPTNTPVPLPTSTPVPLPTSTPQPPPTNTPEPPATNTPEPPPPDTPVPDPSATPETVGALSLSSQFVWQRYWR